MSSPAKAGDPVLNVSMRNAGILDAPPTRGMTIQDSLLHFKEIML